MSETETENANSEVQNAEPSCKLFITPVANPVAGSWVLVKCVQDIRDAIQELREEYGDVDMMVADSEDIPRDIIPKVGIPEAEVHEYLRLTDNYDEEVVKAYLERYSNRVPDVWKQDLDDRYVGTYRDRHEFVNEYIERFDTGDIPVSWISYQEIVEDLAISCEYHFIDIDSGVVVLRDRI